MNLKLILQGFVKYLEEQNLITEEEAKQAKTNADISIFSYSSEFKQYLKEELSIFDDITSLDFAQLSSMEVEEGQLVFPFEEETDETFENISEEEFELDETLLAEEESEEYSEDEIKPSKDALVEIINHLLKDENVIEVFDLSGDGALDKEEITEFLNILNSEEDTLENLSLTEVFDGLEYIQNEKEGIFENNEFDTEEELPVEAEEEVLDKNITNSSHYSSNNSYSSSSGGKGSADKPKTIDNMSKDELNQELTKAQGQVEEKQEVVSSILDGSHSEIQAKNENTEKLYQTYFEQLQAVDVEMAQKVDKLTQDIISKEAEISTKEQDIVNQEIVISNSEIAYNNATANRKQLEASLATLKSTSTSDMKDEKIADLNSKISQLENKIPQAKEVEKQAEAKLQQDKESLEALKAQKEEFQTQLEELNTQKAELENKILEAYPEVKESLDAYNTSKKECELLKTQLLATHKAGLQKAQERVAEVQDAMNVLENKDVEKEYSVSLYNEQKGKELVEAAHAMLDRYGSSTGYCARGVSRTMNIAYGISMGGHGYQWDSNMDQLVEQGMFAEVTDDYPSADLLSTLPAGAVICWENTGIKDNSGGEYGHVCIVDGKGGEISDHYQNFIIKSVGGRSDQYRIFIPI